MKNLILTVLAISTFSFYGQANACSEQAVKTAQEILDLANQSFSRGNTTVTDIYEAKSHLLEMQLCQSPKDKGICKDLVASLSQAFEAKKMEYKVGAKAMNDMLSTLDKLARAQSQCGL